MAPSVTFDALEPFVIRLLQNNRLDGRMRASLGEERHRSSVAAKQIWGSMNTALQSFRRATSYIRNARDWPTHKAALRSLPNQDAYMSAETAEGELRSFVVDATTTGDWPPDPHAFAEELTDYFNALLEEPTLKLEHLAELFIRYNAELRACFESYLPSSEAAHSAV